MPWTQTVPVGFNWSVSVIKSDIYLCWNPTYVTNWAAVWRMSFLSLRHRKQICHRCQSDPRSLLATFQSTGPSLSLDGHLWLQEFSRLQENWIKRDFSQRTFVVVFMGLISAQSWVVPVLVLCLQGREIQQTWCLKKHQPSKLPPWV